MKLIVKLIPALPLFFAGSPAADEWLFIRGNAVDWNGNPIPYIEAELVTLGGTSQSNSDGSFTIAKQVSAAEPVSRKLEGFSIEIRNNRVILEGATPYRKVDLQTFTVSGKLLKTVSVHPEESGIAVDTRGLLPDAQSVSILVVTVDNREMPYMVFPGTAGEKRMTPMVRAQSAEASAMGDAVLDTLVLSKFGYETARVPVMQYNQTLDTVSLPYSGPRPDGPDGMVPVPAGRFMMGSNKGDGDETPVHEVSLSPFYMDVTEVTQKEYTEILGQTPWTAYTGNHPNPIGDNYPVWNVTWYDAVLFCNAKSKREGLSDTVYSYSSIDGTPGAHGVANDIQIHYDRVGYRLPTEAEWEYACRAGTRTEWYWGEQNSEDSLAKYEWYEGNSDGQPHEVGLKEPNPLGLFDMAGNMEEFCNDWSGLSYPVEPKTNPAGIHTGTKRVIRGGSYRFGLDIARSAERGYVSPASVPEGQISSAFRTTLPVR